MISTLPQPQGVVPVPRKPGPETVTVKIRRPIYKQAKMVSAHKDIDLSVYLSDLLAALVARDYGRMVADLGRQENGQAGPGR
jgi:hypothetical protein